MSGKFDDFEKNVDSIESTDLLAPYAKRSFEPFSDQFIDGVSIREYYIQEIEMGTLRSDYRTPLQRERDRIVHGAQLRNLAEKFHVLFFEDQKISRNYITHVMRMAQITRSDNTSHVLLNLEISRN
ncbi:Deoxyguanosinetriphosphate triphosphohydrolase-like protein [subsurface metagenome]